MITCSWLCFFLFGNFTEISWAHLVHSKRVNRGQGRGARVDVKQMEDVMRCTVAARTKADSSVIIKRRRYQARGDYGAPLASVECAPSLAD